MKTYTVVKPAPLILMCSFYVLALLLAVGMYKYLHALIGILFFLFCLYWFASLIYNSLMRKIIIGGDGVKYVTPRRELRMSWEEIGSIGIIDIHAFRYGWIPWIYFSAGTGPVMFVTIKDINEKFFMLNYRKSVIEEIRKYWRGDIINWYNLPLPHEKRDYSGKPFTERLHGNKWFMLAGVIFGMLCIVVALGTTPLAPPFGWREWLASGLAVQGGLIIIGSLKIYRGGWRKIYGILYAMAVIFLTCMMATSVFWCKFSSGFLFIA